MGTRRADILINRIREQTGNQDYGANAGIADTHIVEYMNNGLEFIEEGITSEHSKQFQAESFISLVASQEKYDLPDDYLQSGGTVAVYYALGDVTGNNPNWVKLKRVGSLERGTGFVSQYPGGYRIVNKQLWLTPIPSTAKTNGVRVEYIKRLSRLDIRRGKISAVTLNTGALSITSMTVTNYGSPDEFNLNEACCVVDADGTLKMRGIKLDGSLTAGAVPVRSGFTYTSGDTAAVGNYVVFGALSSTHQLDLDEMVDRFLIAYAVWKVQRQDSNNDSSEQSAELTSMRDSILAAYATTTEDITLVPELSGNE